MPDLWEETGGPRGKQAIRLLLESIPFGVVTNYFLRRVRHMGRYQQMLRQLVTTHSYDKLNKKIEEFERVFLGRTTGIAARDVGVAGSGSDGDGGDGAVVNVKSDGDDSESEEENRRIMGAMADEDDAEPAAGDSGKAAKEKEKEPKRYSVYVLMIDTLSRITMAQFGNTLKNFISARSVFNP